MDYQETDLHTFLKELFQAMQPDYTVEITHGAQEFGKDLVIVKVDNFTKRDNWCCGQTRTYKW